MRKLGAAGHILIVVLALVLLAGVPIARNFDLFAKGDGSDAVTQATVELPDQPSGDFIVLLNTSIHQDTIDDWTAFFTGEDMPVIFEDIKCLTAKGDVTGQQMAERFQLQLPENQMELRSEDATLLASKSEAGYIDAAVFSSEMADAISLDVGDGSGVAVIRVKGDQQE